MCSQNMSLNCFRLQPAMYICSPTYVWGRDIRVPAGRQWQRRQRMPDIPRMPHTGSACCLWTQPLGLWPVASGKIQACLQGRRGKQDSRWGLRLIGRLWNICWVLIDVIVFPFWSPLWDVAELHNFKHIYTMVELMNSGTVCVYKKLT